MLHFVPFRHTRPFGLLVLNLELNHWLGDAIMMRCDALTETEIFSFEHSVAVVCIYAIYGFCELQNFSAYFWCVRVVSRPSNECMRFSCDEIDDEDDDDHDHKERTNEQL